MRMSKVEWGAWSAVLGAALWGAAASATYAAAQTLQIETVVSPRELIRLDFADGSKHFVAMMHREGKATGQGILSGASVAEYGMHDIRPGIDAEPRGYLVFTLPGGDSAYVKFVVRGVFVKGGDGRPMLLDNGVWEVVGSTGKLKGLQGAGTVHIKRVPDPKSRKFVLEGELVSAAE